MPNTAKVMDEFTSGSRCCGKLIDSTAGFDVIDCVECGYVHINPVPTAEELDSVYKEEYYSEEKPLFIERVIEDLRWWETVFKDRFEFIESRLPMHRKRILDIGCGPGYFLKTGLERGWKCLGIEPSKQAAAHAMELGIEVKNAFFDEQTAFGITERFDAVHLSEVLEHVPDPASILRTAHGMLDDGGVICCVVPNDYSPVQKVLGDKLHYPPFWLAPPHHVNYFTFDSMAKLLERSGFKVVEKTSMFPIDFFLLMGDNYVGNDNLGRATHARRKRLDIMLDEPELRGFKKDMYRLMAKHGIGREMVVYGEKK